MSQPASNQSCPVCQQEPENFWHFLKCQHLSRKIAYQQMQTAIHQLHTTHRIDPHMTQLLWQGVDSIHNKHSIDEQYDNYPADFQLLYVDQQHIGWDQLFYGRITTSWAYYINHSTQYTTNGTIFYSQVIACIWKYILHAWSTCNNALHPDCPTQQTIQSLAPQVHHLFSVIGNDPALQEYKPRSTPEQILQWPIRTIQNFLSTGYRHIQNHTTAA